MDEKTWRWSQGEFTTRTKLCMLLHNAEMSKNTSGNWHMVLNTTALTEAMLSITGCQLLLMEDISVRCIIWPFW